MYCASTSPPGSVRMKFPATLNAGAGPSEAVAGDSTPLNSSLIMAKEVFTPTNWMAPILTDTIAQNQPLPVVTGGAQPTRIKLGLTHFWIDFQPIYGSGARTRHELSIQTEAPDLCGPSLGALALAEQTH